MKSRGLLSISAIPKKIKRQFQKGKQRKRKEKGEKRKERKEKRISETQARDEWHWLRYYADAFVVSVPAIQERTCTYMSTVTVLELNKVRTCARGLAVTSPCTGNYHPPGNFSGSLVLHQPDLD